MINFTQDAVEVSKAVLINFKGRELDIAGLLEGFDLTEDIFSNVMYGSIALTDAIDLKHNFPLIGEERVRLKWRTPGFAFVEAEFYINDVPVSEKKNEVAQSLVLSFVSEEFLLNRTQLVSKSFKNSSPSEIVKALIAGLPSRKKVIAEESFGLQNYIVPRLHPFEAIHSMTTRARSKTHTESASYLFYENLDGFNFETLDAMVMSKSTTYTMQQNSNMNPDQRERFYSITGYEIDTHFDIVDNFSSGMYGSRVMEVDTRTRSFQMHDYDYFDKKNYGKNQHLEGGNDNLRLQTSMFSFKERVRDGQMRMVPKYANDQLRAKNIAVRQSHLAQFMNGFRIRVEVSGNSDLRAGDVIDLKMPGKLVDDMKNQKNDRYLSGKYLITSLRHTIIGKSYKTILELTKDSYRNDHEQTADDMFKRIDLKGRS